MIMTTGTGDRQTQESARYRIDLIVDNVVDIVVIHSPECQESHRRQPPRLHGRLDQVGSQLLADELVKGGILIQGPNHIVTIGIRIRPHSVVAIHQHSIFRVGKSGDIQPVSSPAFAITR